MPKKKKEKACNILKLNSPAQPSEARQLVWRSEPTLSPESPTTGLLEDLGQAFGTALRRSRGRTGLQRVKQRQGTFPGGHLYGWAVGMIHKATGLSDALPATWAQLQHPQELGTHPNRQSHTCPPSGGEQSCVFNHRWAHWSFAGDTDWKSRESSQTGERILWGPDALKKDLSWGNAFTLSFAHPLPAVPMSSRHSTVLGHCNFSSIHSKKKLFTPHLCWGPAFHSPQLSALRFTGPCHCWHFRSFPTFPHLRCPFWNPFPPKEDPSNPALPEQGLCCAYLCSLLWILFLAPPAFLISSYFLRPQGLTNSIKSELMCFGARDILHFLDNTQPTRRASTSRVLGSKFKVIAFQTPKSHIVELFYTIMRTINLL